MNEKTITRRMSPNQLRARLISGFAQLLAVLPEGDEVSLDCQYRDKQGFPLENEFVTTDPIHDLALLSDFSKMVGALRGDSEYAGHTVAETRWLMGKEGNGTQLVLIGATDAFCQQHLD